MREKEDLTLLGNQNTAYRMDYDPSVLESFQNKHPENDYFVKFNCPEFTSPDNRTLQQLLFHMFRTNVLWKVNP